MGTWTRVALGAVVVLGAAGCQEAADPPPPDTSVTVLNLNAAMGYHLGPGDPLGTDATAEDIGRLADDVLAHPADVVNLQEMARTAAEDLRAVLAERTGAEWQLNWAHSTFASYYAGESADEPPVWQDESAGNAQLVRIGAGVRSQEPLTVDGDTPGGRADQGVMLPSGGRSFQGAEITTADGVIDVYNLHLARAQDAPDERRAADVRHIQAFTEARTNPAIITGDFNQVIDYPATDQPETIGALAAFMLDHGYTDVARTLGPTSNRQGEWYKKLLRLRIDYILTRDLDTQNAARIDSDQSDHWGLVATVVPGSERADPPATTTPEADPDRFRQELPGGGTFYFFTNTAGTYSCGIDKVQAVCQGETKPVPPRPASCPEGGPGWGHGMWVGAGGDVGFTCAGGLIFWTTDGNPGPDDVLAPGESFSALGFTCAGEDSGFRCAHESSGHGFAIRPEDNERF